MVIWTPFGTKAIIVGVNFEHIVGKGNNIIIQNIPEVLLEDMGIHDRKSIVLHNNIPVYPFVLYAVIHYPATKSILAFQFPLRSTTVSQYPVILYQLIWLDTSNTAIRRWTNLIATDLSCRMNSGNSSIHISLPATDHI